MSGYVYLVEIAAFITPSRTSTTLRYATGLGHTTGPAETPANTYYDARLQQPGVLSRSIFGPGRTSGRSVVGFGDIVLENADGALDVLLDYSINSRSVIVRRGLVGAAYPSGFTTVFSGTCEQVNAQGQTIVVKVRDWQAVLDVPLLSARYAGTNVPPNGLEGLTTDIGGTLKPYCLGAATNVPAVLVNPAKLIYQVSDNALASIGAVYDSGIALVEPPSTSVNAQFGANVPGTGHSLAYGNGIFVAVGNNGQVSTSPDGTNWTSRTSGFGASQVLCVAFGAGTFMIGGLNKLLSTSTDGITWTAQTLPAGWGATDDVNEVAYGNGTWVAVGQTGVVASSTNAGVSWTARTSGLGAVLLDHVIYGAGTFVITALASASIAISVDQGATWSTVVPDAAFTAGGSIAYGNGYFVCRNNTPGDIYRSRDARVWVRHAVGPTVSGNITFTNGFFFNPVSNDIRQSADGLLWTRAVNTASALWTDIIANDAGLYVSAGTLAGAALHYVAGAAGNYASVTALQDDAQAPMPGRFKTYLAGGYFRLGSTPAGVVTADIAQGTAAANRTAAQLFTVALTKIGFGGTWSTSDITALDAANASVCGLWWADDRSIADILDQLAASVGAWWGVDRTGTYRIKQLLAPSGTAVMNFTANDLLKPPARVALGADETRGLPQWRTTLLCQHNYTVQTTGLAAGVSDTRRGLLAVADQEASVEDALVRELYVNPPVVRETTLLQSMTNALTEARRRQVMRGILRHRYELLVQLDDDTDTLDLGDVVSLTHSRYSLSAGALFRIIGIVHDFRRNTVLLTVWGPADPTSLLRLSVPVLSGTGTVT